MNQLSQIEKLVTNKKKYLIIDFRLECLSITMKDISTEIRQQTYTNIPNYLRNNSFEINSII